MKESFLTYLTCLLILLLCALLRFYPKTLLCSFITDILNNNNTIPGLDFLYLTFYELDSI